jgi:hypothetical protein
MTLEIRLHSHPAQLAGWFSFKRIPQDRRASDDFIFQKRRQVNRVWRIIPIEIRRCARQPGAENAMAKVENQLHLYPLNLDRDYFHACG